LKQRLEKEIIKNHDEAQKKINGYIDQFKSCLCTWTEDQLKLLENKDSLDNIISQFLLPAINSDLYSTLKSCCINHVNSLLNKKNQPVTLVIQRNNQDNRYQLSKVPVPIDQNRITYYQEKSLSAIAIIITNNLEGKLVHIKEGRDRYFYIWNDDILLWEKIECENLSICFCTKYIVEMERARTNLYQGIQVLHQKRKIIWKLQ